MDATTTETAANPLTAAFGAPLAIFAVVRLPDPEARTTRPEVHARLHRMARGLAADFKVELGRCECCGAGIAEHVVGEAGAGPHPTRRRFVVCRDCVADHGGRTLRTKLAHMDHTAAGFARCNERAAAATA